MNNIHRQAFLDQADFAQIFELELRASNKSPSTQAMTMYEMNNIQYQAVYNILSFSLASMSSTTMYLWMRAPSLADKYRSAVIISGLGTFIAASHYMRIFDSWVAAHEFAPQKENPKLTGVPFNDAYRYMDWLLTVPLLLIEILLVMKLEKDDFKKKTQNLQECLS